MPAKIQKRGNNSYRLNVSSGFDEYGKRIVYSKTIECYSDKDARTAYKYFAVQVLNGQAVRPDAQHMTLAEFYAYWTKHYVEGNLSAATRACNEAVSVRILSALGAIRLDKLTPRHIIDLITQLREPAASVSGKPLSGATVQKHFHLLKELLSYAVKWELLAVNPAGKIDTPKRDKKQKAIPSIEEFALFFKTVMSQAGTKQKLWTLMAFDMGMRREEIFGLKIGDIDFKEQTLCISRAAVYTPNDGITIKETKTDSGNRVLPLSPMTLEVLKQYLSELKRATKNKVIKLDNPIGQDKWLFRQTENTVGHPHSFNNFLRRICADHNLCHISPHTLRHLSGSYLLKSGVDLATISQMLGHAKKSFTANTYIHALQKTDRQTANAMQNIMTSIMSD